MPVFQQAFWLDAVAENWDVVLYEDQNEIVAALPFAYKGNFLTKRIILPELSFYQSILFFKSFDKKKQLEIIDNLFSQLPKTLKQYFKFLPEYSNIDLLQLKYVKKTYITQVIKSAVQLSKHHARKIDKARKNNFIVNKNENLKEAYQLFVQTFQRQNIKFKLSFNDFKKLVQLVQKYKCGNLYLCTDKSNQLMAAALIVEDQQAAYYLLGAYNTEYKNSGAMHFLLHDIISEKLNHKLDFNFCGSSRASICQFFKGFGSEDVAIAIWEKSILK